MSDISISMLINFGLLIFLKKERDKAIKVMAFAIKIHTKSVSGEVAKQETWY